MTYKTGYRRPPLSSRFKKGQSGNPKGRPKGSSNFLTILEQELGQPIVVNENGKTKKITRMQAMVKRMVAGALQGEQRQLLTLVEILKRTGRFQDTEVENLLPDDYESILDTYVEQRQKLGIQRSRKTTSSKDQS